MDAPRIVLPNDSSEEIPKEYESYVYSSSVSPWEGATPHSGVKLRALRRPWPPPTCRGALDELCFFWSGARHTISSMLESSPVGTEHVASTASSTRVIRSLGKLRDRFGRVLVGGFRYLGRRTPLGVRLSSVMVSSENVENSSANRRLVLLLFWTFGLSC